MLSLFLLVLVPLWLWGMVTLFRNVRGRVQQEHPTCAQCGYALTGLDLLACPECGVECMVGGVIGTQQMRGMSAWTWLVLWSVLILLILGIAFDTGQGLGPRQYTMRKQVLFHPQSGMPRTRLSHALDVSMHIRLDHTRWGRQWYGASSHGVLGSSRLTLPPAETGEEMDVTLHASAGASSALKVIEANQVMVTQAQVEAWLEQASGPAMDRATLSKLSLEMHQSLVGLSHGKRTLQYQHWRADNLSPQSSGHLVRAYTLLLGGSLFVFYLIGPLWLVVMRQLIRESVGNGGGTGETETGL